MNMSKPIALITGANKGIGFETARQLGKRGYRVIVTARDPGRIEEAAKKLQAEGFDATAVVLDVTKPQAAREAAKTVETKFGQIDVLINNAGIALERAGVIDADLEKFRATYETNVIGVVAVTQAFLPLLKKSKAGRIVNVSSGLGSLALRQDPQSIYAQVIAAAYNSSKSALNMLSVILAQELAGTAIKVNIADPGYTATDINANQGTQTVQEGTEAIVRLATLDADGPTGQYFDRHGTVPW
jgi:NAD(P)-dependent dehydrogenase (short-subunit alcohol dehydrogenase family)